MARGVDHHQYTLTASAADLATALSLTGNTHFSKITVKNATGAANALYLGDSDVANTPANAGMEVDAGSSYTYGGDGRGFFDAASIYIVGTVNAANIAFITLES